MSAGTRRARVRVPRARALSTTAGRLDRAADLTLRVVCLGAAVLIGVVLLGVAFQVVHGAHPALTRFGLRFVTESAWRPNFDVFGAVVMLYGTAVTALAALALATPIGIAIGLFLALLAPRAVRGPVGALVEMLAAIPSVVLGFWGLIVLAPFVHAHLEPALHRRLGFTGLFGAPPSTGASVFTAALVLTIMVVPIVASVSRELFATVPRELQEGAAALGATRWEVIRGVVLPATAPGVAAAAVLGLGRALGEAIAVTQVIGAGSAVKASLFETGDTLASRVANQFQGALSPLHTASLFGLALLLLVIGLAATLAAEWIGRRFDPARVL